MEYDKILVVCVDRDADIKRKAGEEGPIWGRERALEVALRLGLADPAESDTNTIFEAVRIFDSLKKEGMETEVVIITGAEDRGLVADTALSRQIDEMLAHFDADGAIVVTDGADDEYVLPLLQSRVPVLSLRRVIVRQSEKLESTYYVIQDFLKEVVSDPKLSRLILGLPGIVLILWMLLGSEYGGRLIGGTIGVFLLIKGFGLEDLFRRAYEEMRSSLISGKMSFFTYVLSALVGIAGAAIGYTATSKAAEQLGGFGSALPVFASSSVYYLVAAGIIALVGKSIDAVLEGGSARKYFVIAIFVLALGLITDAVSLFLLGSISNINLAVMVFLGTMLAVFGMLSFRSVKRLPQPTESKKAE